MTTLTLDQAKTLIYSASNCDEALAALLAAGVQVLSHENSAYTVDCGDLNFISFTELPYSKILTVLVDADFVTPEQRKAFLESQQQNTSIVPANEQTQPSLMLDKAETIISSASNANAAFSVLSESGYNVKSVGSTYFLYVDIHTIVFFDSPTSSAIYVFLDNELVKLDKLLESQQQPTESVPAESTAVETRPLSPSVSAPIIIEEDSPTFNFLVSIMPITDLGGVYQDSPYEHEIFKRLTARKHWLSHETGHPVDILDLSLFEVLNVIKAVSHEFENQLELSTEPVDNSNPELTVFCPSCDYHSATAQKDTESCFYHVICSQCGLDADRDTVYLFPSSLQPHQAQ